MSSHLDREITANPAENVKTDPQKYLNAYGGNGFVIGRAIPGSKISPQLRSSPPTPFTPDLPCDFF